MRWLHACVHRNNFDALTLPSLPSVLESNSYGQLSCKALRLYKLQYLHIFSTHKFFFATFFMTLFGCGQIFFRFLGIIWSLAHEARRNIRALKKWLWQVQLNLLLYIHTYNYIFTDINFCCVHHNPLQSRAKHFNLRIQNLELYSVYATFSPHTHTHVGVVYGCTWMCLWICYHYHEYLCHIPIYLLCIFVPA